MGTRFACVHLSLHFGAERKDFVMKIIMLGAPGAGKGTQAQMIADQYHIPHVSTGDIFRANIKNGTELGMEAKKYMDEGLLVPAEVLDKALTELGDAIDYAINVDVPDENIVKRMSGRRACLSCGSTYHMEHIPPKKEGVCDKCGNELVLRDDDKPETVLNRLEVYHKQTQPLIQFYEEKGVLRTVDGTKPMKEVFDSIVEILKK